MAKSPFRGMAPNSNNMMRQAQKMQRDMQRMQEEMETKTWSATSGGGIVTATVNGHHDVVALKIKPEALDPDDIEMLQDLIITAVNKAMHTSQDEIGKGMAQFSADLSTLGIGL